VAESLCGQHDPLPRMIGVWDCWHSGIIATCILTVICNFIFKFRSMASIWVTEKCRTRKWRTITKREG